MQGEALHFSEVLRANPGRSPGFAHVKLLLGQRAKPFGLMKIGQIIFRKNKRGNQGFALISSSLNSENRASPCFLHENSGRGASPEFFEKTKNKAAKTRAAGAIMCAHTCKHALGLAAAQNDWKMARFQNSRF